MTAGQYHIVMTAIAACAPLFALANYLLTLRLKRDLALFELRMRREFQSIEQGRDHERRIKRLERVECI